MLSPVVYSSYHTVIHSSHTYSLLTFCSHSLALSVEMLPSPAVLMSWSPIAQQHAVIVSRPSRCRPLKYDSLHLLYILALHKSPCKVLSTKAFLTELNYHISGVINNYLSSIHFSFLIETKWGKQCISCRLI